MFYIMWICEIIVDILWKYLQLWKQFWLKKKHLRYFLLWFLFVVPRCVFYIVLDIVM